jgi:hypothetical protein
MLGQELVSQFGTVLFFNDLARGPFSLRKNGQWLGEFTAMLSGSGIVGSVISCQGGPHVQTHSFAMRSGLAWDVLSRHFTSQNSKLEVSISQDALALGHSMSSIFDKWHSRGAFHGHCRSPTRFDI